MAPSVRRYFQEGLAPATQKTYGAALKRFHTSCTTYSITTPFPVTEHLLCCFAAYLADQGLAPQMGRSYLSAVRNMQISFGLPDASTSKGVSRYQKDTPSLWGIQTHSPSPHCPGPQTDPRVSWHLRQPREGSTMGHSFIGFLRILPAGL